MQINNSVAITAASALRAMTKLSALNNSLHPMSWNSIALCMILWNRKKIFICVIIIRWKSLLRIFCKNWNSTRNKISNKNMFIKKILHFCHLLIFWILSKKILITLWIILMKNLVNFMKFLRIKLSKISTWVTQIEIIINLFSFYREGRELIIKDGMVKFRVMKVNSCLISYFLLPELLTDFELNKKKRRMILAILWRNWGNLRCLRNLSWLLFYLWF